MKAKKIYRSLSYAGTLVGIGMLLGYSLGQGTTNTPLWIGGLLIFISAVLLGMSLNDSSARKSEDEEAR